MLAFRRRVSKLPEKIGRIQGVFMPVLRNHIINMKLSSFLTSGKPLFSLKFTSIQRILPFKRQNWLCQILTFMVHHLAEETRIGIEILPWCATFKPPPDSLDEWDRAVYFKYPEKNCQRTPVRYFLILSIICLSRFVKYARNSSAYICG